MAYARPSHISLRRRSKDTIKKQSEYEKFKRTPIVRQYGILKTIGVHFTFGSLLFAICPAIGAAIKTARRKTDVLLNPFLSFIEPLQSPDGETIRPLN